MAGGVTLSVRQIGSYPSIGGAGPGDLLLVQPGGLGNPYGTVDAALLVETALNQRGLFAVGTSVPAGADPGQIFTATNHVLPLNASMAWNCFSNDGQFLGWSGGSAGFQSFGAATGFTWAIGSAGGPDQPVGSANLLNLSLSGALSLSRGTLTVARDPGAALEVATMGWVGRSTVTSFNGRQGAVTLNGCDIYSALCLDSTIATETWVCTQLQASIQMLLANHPFVFGWNGRTGAVYLTLADISCVFMQPGQQPISQTPPAGSNDNSIATTAWVVNYLANLDIEGSGIATQAWVEANTVASFNGRIGTVTLSVGDIQSAGGAPINSPQFTGTPQAPTAAPGQATGQIATTLFVMNAVQAAVTGVISFNGRTGAITLDATDLNDAGGALLASPAFTGIATAPTAAVGTATTQLATCAFVLNEVQAIGAGVTSFNSRSGNVVLELTDIEGAGGAPIASPAFSGTPTTPTPLNPITGNAEIANTQWVVQYIGLAAVSSFNGRNGAITLSAADISGAGGLANPNVALTGVPTAPTALPGTSTTQIATTNFVMAAISNVGGNYVPLAGNVNISGPLAMLGAGSTFTLAGNAAANLQAVPLQQLNSTLTGYAALTGATFTGPVALPSGSTIAGYLPLTGGGLTGQLTVQNSVSTGLFQAGPTLGSNPAFTVSQAGQSTVGFNNAGSIFQVGSFAATGALASQWGLIGPSGTWVTGSFTCTGNSSQYQTIYTFAGNGHVYSLRWDGSAMYIYVDNSPLQVSLVSDRRRKFNIVDSTVDALAALLAIPLKSFTMTQSVPHTGHDPEDLNQPQPTQDVDYACGPIAQDVAAAIPLGTNTGPEDLLVINWNVVNGWMLKALQQLAGRVAELEARLA